MSWHADRSREAGPYHRVARNQSGESHFAQAFGSGRTLGYHEIAHLGGRVPDADLRARRQSHTELRQYAARIPDHARPIRCALVPDRWQSQHRPRVAAAERADNDVVSAGRVRDGNHVLALSTGITQFGNSGGRIAHQSFSKCRIYPGARDDARAVARTDFRLVGVDQYIECCRIDVALLGHHRLERADAPLDVAEFAVIFRQGVFPAATDRYWWKLIGLATISRRRRGVDWS